MRGQAHGYTRCSESHISGPHDVTHLRFHMSSQHRSLSLSSYLTRIASISSVCLHLHYIKIIVFLNIEHPRIAQLVSHLTIPIAPRVQPDMACAALNLSLVKFRFGNCIRRTILYIDGFHSLALFVLSISPFSSPVVP